MEDMTRKEARLWITYYMIHRIPCPPERLLELIKIAYNDDPFDVDFDPMQL